MLASVARSSLAPAANVPTGVYALYCFPTNQVNGHAICSNSNGRYCTIELSFALAYLLLTIIEYPASFKGIPPALPAVIEIICLAFFVTNLVLRGKAAGAELSFEMNPGFSVRIFVVVSQLSKSLH